MGTFMVSYVIAMVTYVTNQLVFFVFLLRETNSSLPHLYETCVSYQNVDLLFRDIQYFLLT